MAFEAQTGMQLSMGEAERITGFVAGRATWSYAAMLAFADAGLDVIQIEATSPDAFAADPVQEVRRLYGDVEATRWVLRHDALAPEIERVRRCLDHPQIHFRVREPTLDDLRRALTAGASVIVSLNHNRLLGGDGYTPHFVIVVDSDESQVVLDNPGPPGRPGQVVALDLFLAAWRSPRSEMANALVVSTRSSVG